MTRTRGVLVAALVLLLIGVAWTLRPGPTIGAAPSEARRAESPVSSAAQARARVQVPIEEFRYQPTTVTVPAGTTVVWTNLDEANHTVTADDDSFDSGLLGLNEAFSYTFTTPGEYGYYCIPHGAPGSGQWGIVVVTP